VLDALIDGEDGDISGAAEAAGVEDVLEIAQDAGGAVGGGEDAVDEIGAGEVEQIALDALGV
jgi:predicted regulator of Ras-like GTPase activity (Roadblock/LC7/MglB family)